MREILEDFQKGKLSINQCENLLKSNEIMELNNVAKLDINRKARTGFPEAILAETKDYDDLLLIINGFFKNSHDDKLLITRLSNERYLKLKEDISYLKSDGLFLNYNKKAKILIIKKDNEKPKVNYNYKVGIITAGTSDIPIAEESKVILEESGVSVLTSYDIGVAGIHRLFPNLAEMIKENVKILIVCAGMEGALPSVIAGLVDIPIIAVPTSIGYGVGQGGITALNAMLQSCAPGMSVVNIDNGFGAAVNALTILNTFDKK
ncbi:nickel pincer cofactor biosynthesis protein LarB [Methanobrevibacter wolinii]|uniref:nickel pincer cofactor biosynthesis protein LarB n=1 Tax=Methanobrevibacter wolinii TaxID=190977 RepID=UPI0005B2D678|nr:nickel pincer cofactor biosynthesis protein LarB [Methanobrevibacter wolinii]MDD5960539.1 nickel pincer cofactor biosynthesis protein LarB [Methanobrevibacter wolinii]